MTLPLLRDQFAEYLRRIMDELTGHGRAPGSWVKPGAVLAVNSSRLAHMLGRLLLTASSAPTTLESVLNGATHGKIRAIHC